MAARKTHSERPLPGPLQRIGHRVAASALAVTLLIASAAAAALDERPEVREFAVHVAETHGIDADRVLAILEHAEHDPRVIERIESPAEALPWHRYREIFVTRERAEQGAHYWETHADTVADISAEYGVDAAILIAILGVESRYGEHVGDHRVLDALFTLGFDHDRRDAFFRRELGEFLALAEEEGFDPREPVGSYAGAMGKSQFIASSYRAYAVDHDGDGQRDLFNNPADALASIASYLTRHGWTEDGPVTQPVQVTGAQWEPLRSPLNRPVRARHTVAHLLAAGVRSDNGVPEEQPAALIALDGADGDEFWMTHDNFYAITRYNHSALYALAVHQLAERIREVRAE